MKGVVTPITFPASRSGPCLSLCLPRPDSVPLRPDGCRDESRQSGGEESEEGWGDGFEGEQGAAHAPTRTARAGSKAREGGRIGAEGRFTRSASTIAIDEGTERERLARRRPRTGPDECLLGGQDGDGPVGEGRAPVHWGSDNRRRG